MTFSYSIERRDGRWPFFNTATSEACEMYLSQIKLFSEFFCSIVKALLKKTQSHRSRSRPFLRNYDDEDVNKSDDTIERCQNNDLSIVQTFTFFSGTKNQSRRRHYKTLIWTPPRLSLSHFLPMWTSECLMYTSPLLQHILAYMCH